MISLRCPNGCRGNRFVALNTPLYVDSGGRYLEHDPKVATYLCAECQAVSVDVGAAARELGRDQSALPQLLVCPACGTRMLPPEDDYLPAMVECPVCETRFGLEEGLPRLHGGDTEPE